MNRGVERQDMQARIVEKVRKLLESNWWKTGHTGRRMIGGLKEKGFRVR